MLQKCYPIYSTYRGSACFCPVLVPVEVGWNDDGAEITGYNIRLSEL